MLSGALRLPSHALMTERNQSRRRLDETKMGVPQHVRARLTLLERAARLVRREGNNVGCLS